MIHFHGTSCGATRDDVARFLAGRDALIPWPRPEDLPTAAAVCRSFCLDNGAFSAWRKGEPVTDWSGYYEWCREWSKHPAFAFAIIPDVIDGDEKANDELIRDWDRKMWHPVRVEGVPVWHVHESLERLKRLANGRYHRVAIGSSGQWGTPGTDGWWERMGESMAAICDEHGRPPCKLHGLRMLDPEIFTKLPLASADSTNAVRNSSGFSRFGIYVPPLASTRMGIIAERIESQQSSGTWEGRPQQEMLELWPG